MAEMNLVRIVEERPILVEEVEQLLDEYQRLADEKTKQLDQFKETLLQVMMANGIYSADVGKYKLSVVVPNDIVEFDKEAFLEKENEDIVLAFSEVKTSEPVFNLEKFKEEHPDLYVKYCETTDTIVVDTDKLEKTLPKIFNKYKTVTKSKRKISLRIMERKQK